MRIAGSCSTRRFGYPGSNASCVGRSSRPCWVAQTAVLGSLSMASSARLLAAAVTARRMSVTRCSVSTQVCDPGATSAKGSPSTSCNGYFARPIRIIETSESTAASPNSIAEKVRIVLADEAASSSPYRKYPGSRRKRLQKENSCRAVAARNPCDCRAQSAAAVRHIETTHAAAYPITHPLNR